MIATLQGLREDVSRLSRDVETLRSEVHKKSHKVKFDLGNVSHLFYHSGEFVDCIESINSIDMHNYTVVVNKI